MGATSKMIWKVLCVLYLATSSSVLCGAVSVPAPPLELQEIILTGTETTTPPALEPEAAAIQPEEINAESEIQTPKLEDNDLNKVSPQTDKTKSESEASSSVTQAINVDVSQDSLQTEATELREAATNSDDQEDMTALPPLETAVLVPEVTPSTTQAPPTQLSALERQSLIGHLVGISDQKSLVLTEKQKLALQQERSFQNQGYRAFSSASDQKGQTGFPEQPRRIQNFNQQQSQQQQFSFQQQQQFDFQQPPQFGSQQKSQLGLQQPQQLGLQQPKQLGLQQPQQLGLQQPQQQLFGPKQTEQFSPQLKQQFERTNEQFRGQLQQQRPNRIQPQSVFQQKQLSQLQPQSNQIPGQQFRTNPEAVIRTPQQQEAALKKSLLSALQNSFIN